MTEPSEITADTRLPQLPVETIQQGVRALLEGQGIKEGSKAAFKAEHYFLAGHEMTHHINPAIFLSIVSGRSILTL